MLKFTNAEKWVFYTARADTYVFSGFSGIKKVAGLLVGYQDDRYIPELVEYIGVFFSSTFVRQWALLCLFLYLLCGIITATQQ